MIVMSNSKRANKRIREIKASKGWWYARFRMKWPENEVPIWHIDLLLAHKVVAPVLYKYKKNITLWRFHRRAARDIEGHQFSITFYCSPRVALQIFDSLKANKLLKRLKSIGLIVQDVYDDTSRISTPKIEDTSDGNWSPQIRKSWPYFIMGVCQMWLNLISEISEKHQARKRLSLEQTLTTYKQVNEEITKYWQLEGGHSLLHHLNAIFGYEPVLVHEVNYKRF